MEEQTIATCNRCGWKSHGANDLNGTTKNAVCRKCELKGHYVRQCKTQHKGKAKENAIFVSENNNGEQNTTEDNEDEYVFTVDQKMARLQ